MIPLMLLLGACLGVAAIGGVAVRTLAGLIIASSLVWGVLVGANASSLAVGIGGTALAAVNIAVSLGVVWAIGWPIRRRNPPPG